MNTTNNPNSPNNLQGITMKKSLFVAMISSAILSACGGGGGGSSTSTPPVATTCTSPQVLVNGVCTNPVSTVIPANLQSNVPVPTYAAGSVQLLAYTQISDVRKLIGLGPLAQSAKIDSAALNHSKYVNLNIDSDSSVFGHYENAGLSGFTGVTPGDRNSFVGYTGPVSEIMTSDNYQADQNTPVERFLGSVYHRSAILSQCSKDIGIGYQSHTTPAGLIANPVVIDMGISAPNTCQTNASDFVYSYPVANQTNVPVSMTAETPFPFPDVPKNQYNNFDVANATSFPITIGVYAGYTLTMDSITVTEQGQTTPLPMRVLTSANDTNKLLSAEQMYFVGYAPFKSATTYNVVFKGAANGSPVTKSFSITTR